MRMFREWLSLMKSALDGEKEWYDALGELYMAFSSTNGRSAQGQFFTPPPVCDLMVACTANNGGQQGFDAFRQQHHAAGESGKGGNHTVIVHTCGNITRLGERG